MKPITFYPGPSKVYPQIVDYMQDAYNEGVLSVNHRSDAFAEVLKKTIELIHDKLNVPSDYRVYLVSSATEVWEIVGQSLTKQQSTHFYNGAFGKKWFYYAAKIVPQASASWFDMQRSLAEYLFKNDANIAQHNIEKLADAELICLTHNETSNGTQLTVNDLLKIKEHTNALVTIDATSSLGGLAFDWTLGDVWFASVQKCLGLPAGLGIMVCSPNAMVRAEQLNDRSRYNSLLNIDENFQKLQTHYTPNVLGIYLLMRVLEQIPNIDITHKITESRAKNWYDFIENNTDWQLLIKNPIVRSSTVLAIEGAEYQINTLKQKATERGITIGNGYGEWRNDTFRIANFPAIDDGEIEILKALLIKK